MLNVINSYNNRMGSENVSNVFYTVLLQKQIFLKMQVYKVNEHNVQINQTCTRMADRLVLVEPVKYINDRFLGFTNDSEYSGRFGH